MRNNPAHILIEAIGHSTLCECLGLTERNLRHAKSVGYFAAKWYAPMKALAESHGVHCPLEAFNFERLANKVGSNKAANQGLIAEKAIIDANAQPTGDAT
ncbi:hypothetical protein [Yoonia sp.]|uniref:hypothetical protein n=1 Tax=Yoonia sp. TaxID=2212373 RepID=UPI002DF8E5EE|nr:hypothetical protein [Yoonia sp.]